MGPMQDNMAGAAASGLNLEIVFGIIAAVLTLAVVGLFARALLGRRNSPEVELKRLEENVEVLQDEYRRLEEKRAEGGISAEAFEARERELCLRVLDEIEPEAPLKERQGKIAGQVPFATALTALVAIPAVTVGLYLTYGDFSSLAPKAQEQIEMVRAMNVAEANMLQNVARLEESVKKNPDRLEAWEILADHYNQQGDLARAKEAYEHVVRLDPKNVVALAELADLLVAVSDGQLTDEAGAYAKRALEIDPYNQKALIVGGAFAFDRADWKEAVILFNRLKAQFPEDDEVAQALDHNVKMAMSYGKMTEAPKDPVPPKPDDMNMMRMLDEGKNGGMPGMGGMPGVGGGMPGMGFGSEDLFAPKAPQGGASGTSTAPNKP